MTSDHIDFGHEAYDELALLIGRVCMAWNDLQFSVFGLFQLVTNFDHNAAQVGFFSIRQDAAQRDITQAMFAEAFARYPDWVKKTDAIFSDIGSLSGERNAAVHTAWAYWLAEKRMGPSLPEIAHKKLTDDPAAQFADLTARITALNTRLLEVIDEAVAVRHWSSPPTWPPQLGAVPPDQ